MGEKYKDFFINLAIGVLVVVFVYWLDAGRGYPFLHSLCDGFFVATVLLLGVGGLRWVRNKGIFDVVGFGIDSVVKITFPFLKGEKEDIHEYRERKAEQRKGAGGLLAAGMTYLILSVLALCLYYMVHV